MKVAHDMRVKICGLMRSKDVVNAVENGADAVGFVVGSPSSPRNLEMSSARALFKLVPVFTTKVAVTSETRPRNALKICSVLRPDAVQLHKHRPNLVRLVRKRYPGISIILATSIQDQSSVARATGTSNHCDAVLADSPSNTGIGGTGRTHDWELTAKLRNRIYPHPLILAGGLTPANVQQAIIRIRPFAVDVSSGVEKRIGVKDHRKIKLFIDRARGL